MINAFSDYKVPTISGGMYWICWLLSSTKICCRRYEYRWADGVNIKKPIEVSAPKYVEYLMGWIETQLDDELIFPQNLGIWNFTIFLTLCSWSTHYICINDLFWHRRSIPSQLSQCGQNHIQKNVSCVCAYLSLTFPEDCGS